MKLSAKAKKFFVMALCAALGAALAATGTWAYLSNRTEKPLTNTFIAMGGGKIIEDEDDFKVTEHRIDYEPDGTPVLDPDTELTPDKDGNISQTYKTEPGIDLPKDPFIRVNGKTETPARLYVEVVPSGFRWISGSQYRLLKAEDGGPEGVNNEMSFKMNSDWSLVDGVTGVNGGRVFQYTGAKSSPAGILTLESSGEDNDYYLLEGNRITVENDVSGNGEDMIIPETTNIKFYAYLAQANAGDDAAEAFSNCFINAKTPQ